MARLVEVWRGIGWVRDPDPNKPKGLVSAEIKDYVEEIEALRAQLPEGMQHCTIQFRECEKGHSRLTASNWIDHGCMYCKIDRAIKELSN